MEFITKQDFTTHIYEEAIETISRGDDKKLTEAINTAIGKAKRCLVRYDIEAIFTTEGDEKAKYAELITYIKDVAKYHFIAVCNVQVDYEVAEKRYNAAIKELDKIRITENIPGWPLAEVAATTNIRYGSNPKFFTERW